MKKIVTGLMFAALAGAPAIGFSQEIGRAHV